MTELSDLVVDSTGADVFRFSRVFDVYFREPGYYTPKIKGGGVLEMNPNSSAEVLLPQRGEKNTPTTFNRELLMNLVTPDVYALLAQRFPEMVALYPISAEIDVGSEKKYNGSESGVMRVSSLKVEYEGVAKRK